MASLLKSARVRALLVATMASAFIMAACAGDPAPDTHATGQRLEGNRPECPQKWDSIPQFSRTSEPRAATAASVVNGSRALAGVDSIRDIPEYHDCQKFILENGTYDSLYAIFAKINLDSIGDALVRDSVRWTSSNKSVATITPSGQLTSVASGTTTVIGVSARDSSRRVVASVTVKPGLAPPRDTVIALTGRVAKEVAIPPEFSLSFAAALGATTTQTVSAAVVYTYGPGYSKLGIGPDFNCLYVYYDGDGNLSGKMVKVGALASGMSACASPLNPNTAVGNTLEVIWWKAHKEDLPSVARWDYDDAGKQQYAGVRCGDGWCEIGPPGFQPSKRHLEGDPTNAGEKKVLEIKGWYDEQFLAAMTPGGKPVPSRLRGTVVPDPKLKDRDRRAFEKRFVTVAYVGFDLDGADTATLRQYKEKFNFDPVPIKKLKDMNKMELCFGTVAECPGMPNPPAAAACATRVDAAGKRWWMRLVAAQDSSMKYRCVTRREHPGLPTVTRIAETARWRWLLADETVWDECTQGCCETEVGPGSPIW